jgi:FkbM family methyltransferase
MAMGTPENSHAKCQPVWPVTSYATHFEDVLLGRVFRDAASGFYVDVGACDPLLGSTTRHFYNCGWRGINIEPSFTFDRFPQYRSRDINLQVAASDRVGEQTFLEFMDSFGCSNLSNSIPKAPAEHQSSLIKRRTRTVRTRRLVDIFDEFKVRVIDFMSVDVEGHERPALLGNDWSRYRPKILIIEAVLPCQDVPSHEKWEDILLASDYRVVYFDGVNRFYALGEDYERVVPHFKLPVNPFDHYRNGKLEDAALEIARLKEQIRFLETQVQGSATAMLWARIKRRLRRYIPRRAA